MKNSVQMKQGEHESELERVKTELENEVRELENSLGRKRDELDKSRAEKGKLLQRCEKLETKLLHLKNAPAPSDPSKPQVQIRNSSLVDKLKASNVIAQAAAAGNGA